MGEDRNIRSHPRSPHSSFTAQAAHARASLRPPIFNPYDRFTKPEFDAWIGDITGALKSALSYEAEAEVDSPSRHSSSWNTIPDKIGGSLSVDRRARSPASSDACDDESTFEDSFAQVASRRAKGKARDPREGPGLGLKGLPIELSSDSEEEEVVNSLEVGGVLSEDSDVSSQEGSCSDTDYTESELDEGEEASSGMPGTSAQHIVTLSSSENFGQGQGVDRNTGFAVLRDRGSSDESQYPVQSESPIAVDVELVDPWEGPRTFAEDYYSGGDRLAPSLTPNHLTPLAGSPAPVFVPDLSTVPNSGTDEGRLFPSAGVLSTSLSSKPLNILDGDVIDESPQYGATVATSNKDTAVSAARSYYDPVEVVDATIHAAEDTEADVVESEGARVIKARLTSEDISISCPPKSDLGTTGRDTDQTHEIISLPSSDDEYTEEDERKFLDLMPLGTSDLDIRDDWHGAGRHEDIDDMSEEDELQETVSSQTVDALALSKTVNLSTLDDPLVDLRDPIIASTFQFADTDSFGDLPVSSPPSETSSPAPGQPAGAFESQRHSIEQLFADLERASSGRRSQAPESPGSLARQPEAETADVWPSRELENILSGEISVPDRVVESTTGRSNSQEALSSSHYPGYIVEEVKFEIRLPDDDFDDTRSIPPPDLVEVDNTIRLYDVEEPKTDGRLTEEPEITIESSRNGGTTVPQPVVSPVESTATPITSEQHVYRVPSIQRPSQREPVSDASQAEPSLAVPHIPAPIVADPSVPDPVPGDSSTRSPVITDPPNASGLFIIPPTFTRVIDLDSSQISSSASGLFTPAQRSDGGTPAQLEDDANEALTPPQNGADKGPATASIPLQPELDPSPIERFITGYKDDGDAGDKDACLDDLIEPMQPLPSDEHPVGIETVGGDAQILAVDAIECADKNFSLSSRGTTKLSISQLPKEDSTLTSDVSARNPLKGTPEYPDVPDPSSECRLRSPSIAGGDEDADGEVDPDYSHVFGAKNRHQAIAHQPDDEVTFNKTIRDTLRPKVTTPGLENHPTSPSLYRQESEAVGALSGSLVDTPALQDSPSAESGVVQDKGDFATSVQSELKATDESEHQTRVLKRKRRDPKPGSARITRSESGAGVKKKSLVLSSRRTTAPSEKAQSEWADSNVDADSVDDGTSETASVSSGTSAVYRLLRVTSRARSVVSSASGDASWTSPPASGLGIVIPLIHSHGLHRHDWPAPPSPASSAGRHKGTRSEQVKVISPASTNEPSTPSLRRAPSINSPVTRSNCRFHKISLPRGEDGLRAYFVVPGCALGDGELMKGEDIKDEGFSTHEDHKRMLPNVEALDLNPYLVGVLRQLVGVDLLREQQEIFYLPNEEEKPKKRRQTGALEHLRQFRRQSISTGGPLAREHSPRPPEVSQGHGTPRSASGSVVSGSVREGSIVRSNDGNSIPSEPDSDDDPGETPTKRPRLSSAEINPPPASTFTDGELGHSAVPERSTLAGEEPPMSNRPPPRRSKRKILNYDAAAYKPGEDDIKDDEEVEETKTKRTSARKATKRSRTAEEISTSAPRSKKKRLGRSISAVGAGTMDS